VRLGFLVGLHGFPTIETGIGPGENLLDTLGQGRSHCGDGAQSVSHRADRHCAVLLQQAPTPISRHDARFALIVAQAIFEYFSLENWPGI
jgi:hypothetical protein